MKFLLLYLISISPILALNLEMPNKEQLICCHPSKGKKVVISTINKTVFYCVARVKGKFIRHGNYYSFEKGMLTESKYYQNDKRIPGRKPLQECKNSESGPKLMEKASTSSPPQKTSKGLNPNLSTNNIAQPNTQSPPSSTETSKSDIGKFKHIAAPTECPMTKMLAKQIKEKTNSIPPFRPSCNVKNPAAQAFFKKMTYLIKVSSEEGIKVDPCYEPLHQLRRAKGMYAWEELRIRYCSSDKDPSFKRKFLPKETIRKVSKVAPYQPSYKVSAEFESRKREIRAINEMIGKVASPEVMEGYLQVRRGIEERLNKTPKVKALTEEIIRNMP